MERGKIKFVPVFKEALCSKDVWGSDGTDPRILKLITRWSLMVRFTLLPF